LYIRLTGLTALLKRSFTTLRFRKTEVIDADLNCTAMVHLPEKRALSCIMKNAAATQSGRSTWLRAESARGNFALAFGAPSAPMRCAIILI
jgi:hypothetical protein